MIKQPEDLVKESTQTTKSDNILTVNVEEQLSTTIINEPEFVCNLASFKFVYVPDQVSKIKTANRTIIYEQLP